MSSKPTDHDPSHFAAAWLALREPADRAARAPRLLAAAARWLDRQTAGSIVDLGCGTGSTFRSLNPLLAHPQRWLLVDQDPALLAVAAAQCPGADLHEADIAGDLTKLLPADAHMICASALLDLVSRDWLARLVEAAAGRRAVYAALNVDGRLAAYPALPADAAVFAAFTAHQHRDKGLGRALGPDAGPALATLLESHGFHVETAQADWLLDERAHKLQMAVLDGWRQAAVETGLVTERQAEDWYRDRQALVRSGRSRLTVGHLDILALPPD
jgi:SAM-dependent methyltransferase